MNKITRRFSRLQLLITTACLLAVGMVWDIQHPQTNTTQHSIVLPTLRPTKPIHAGDLLTPQSPPQPQSKQQTQNNTSAQPLNKQAPFELLIQNRPPAQENPSDLFRPHNWVMFVKTPIEEAPPPPPPSAPPVPYQFFGRLKTHQGQTAVYVTRDGELLPIQIGQTLNNIYQVNDITTTEIVVTYLPLNEKQLILIPPETPNIP